MKVIGVCGISNIGKSKTLLKFVDKCRESYPDFYEEYELFFNDKEDGTKELRDGVYKCAYKIGDRVYHFIVGTGGDWDALRQMPIDRFNELSPEDKKNIDAIIIADRSERAWHGVIKNFCANNNCEYILYHKSYFEDDKMGEYAHARLNEINADIILRLATDTFV